MMNGSKNKGIKTSGLYLYIYMFIWSWTCITGVDSLKKIDSLDKSSLIYTESLILLAI